MSGWLRAWAELGRVSNLPTVWTQAVTGLAAGRAAAIAGGVPLDRGDGALGGLPWVLDQGFVLLVGLSLLYVGGMALNDAVDAPRDRRMQPGRPIPSGRITRRAAAGAAAALLGVGVAVLGVYRQPEPIVFGVLLAAAIVGYNLLHARHGSAVVLMGLCRALVVLAAAGAVAAEPDAWWLRAGPIAAAVGLYTLLVTLIARRETDADAGARRWLALGMAVVALSPLAVLRPGAGAWTAADSAAVLIAAIIVLAWLGAAARDVLARPARTGEAVGRWLAGFCLLDAAYLAALGKPAAAALAVALFALTRVLQRTVAPT